MKGAQYVRRVANLIMELKGFEQNIDRAREGVAELIKKLNDLKAEVERLLNETDKLDGALASSSVIGPPPDFDTGLVMMILGVAEPVEKLTEFVKGQGPDRCEALRDAFHGQAQEVNRLMGAARSWRKQSGVVNAKIGAIQGMLAYQKTYNKKKD